MERCTWQLPRRVTILSLSTCAACAGLSQAHRTDGIPLSTSQLLTPANTFAPCPTDLGGCQVSIICTCLLLVGTPTWTEALWPHSPDHQVPSHSTNQGSAPHPHPDTFHPCLRAVHHLQLSNKNARLSPEIIQASTRILYLQYFRRGLILKARRSKCNSVCC